MEQKVAEALKSIMNTLPEGVQLIAVSKTKPVEMIEEAYRAGHRDFGENRIQEMAEKAEKLPRDIRWHMIGNVQSNKIKYMAPFVHLVHGLDKPKRLKDLNKEARKADRVIQALIQIHIAREESKFGFSYQEAAEILTPETLRNYPHLKIRGLMGMATLTDNEDQIRQEFAGLATFYQRSREILKSPDFDILSMGMSGDYQIAIEEGSNQVRIGSAIFGARN